MKKVILLITALLCGGVLFASAIPASAAPSVQVTFTPVSAVASASYSPSGGCIGSGLSSGNYGRSSVYNVTYGGYTYKRYHLSMTGVSPWFPYGIFVGGVKRSGGSEVYVDLLQQVYYVHFRWAAPSENLAIRDCGYYE